MSRPRFLADEDFNDHIVRGVQRREPSNEFLLARDAGIGTMPDADVLAYAAEHAWVVVSHDVNTMTAAAAVRLRAGQPLRGLLLVHQRDPVAPIIDDLILIWASTESADWANQIQFLPL